MATGEAVYETLVRVEELDSLAPEWDALVRAMKRPTPFQLHGWVRAWLRHHPDAEPAIHIARRDGRFIAAFPLAVRKRAGLRLGRFVGDDPPFGDILLDPGEPLKTARGLLDHATANHDYAALLTVTAGSVLVEAAGNDLRLIPKIGAPVLDISRGFDTVYREKTTSHTRNTHGRRQRQLAQLGPIEFELARTPSELERALEEAFRLHDLRWQGRFDRSPLRTSEDRAFQREALRALATDDVARILTLNLDQQAIAFVYYFVLDRRMFVYRLAFDPAYARFSPGLVSMLNAFREASSEGLTTIEFLRGEERYKLELADRVEQLYEGVGLAGGPLGAVASRTRVATRVARARMKRSKTLHRLYLERVGPLLMRLRRARR